MAATRRVVAGLAMAWLVGACGCGEIEWLWGEQGPKRAHSASAPARVESPTTAPSEVGHGEPSPATKPAALEPEERGFCQLVLLSKSFPDKAPPGLKHVRLARASAGAVGELLTVLYPPAGPTGTGQRYTLIYPSSLECDIAADFALQLDVATVEGAALQLPEESQAAFAFGVGVLYATPRGHADEVDRLRLAEAGLVKALNAPAQPARIRWAAAMMAAGVCAERLREYDKAEGYCLEAAKVVEADSLEQMAAWYALARAYVQNGKPDVAQETLTNLITTFEAFAATEVFGRARQALTDLDRKRPR